MWSISLFKTKTFWLNLIGAGIEIFQQVNGTNFLGLNPGQIAEVLVVLNVLNRLLTQQPAHLMESSFVPCPPGSGVNPNVK